MCKIAIFATPLAFNPRRWRGSLHHIIARDISLKTRCFGLHFCRGQFRNIFNHFYAVRAQSYQIRWNDAKYRPLRCSRSFKVTDFRRYRKLICDFLL